MRKEWSERDSRYRNGWRKGMVNGLQDDTSALMTSIDCQCAIGIAACISTVLESCHITEVHLARSIRIEAISSLRCEKLEAAWTARHCKNQKIRSRLTTKTMKGGSFSASHFYASPILVTPIPCNDRSARPVIPDRQRCHRAPHPCPARPFEYLPKQSTFLPRDKSTGRCVHTRNRRRTVSAKFDTR